MKIKIRNTFALMSGYSLVYPCVLVLSGSLCVISHFQAKRKTCIRKKWIIKLISVWSLTYDSNIKLSILCAFLHRSGPEARPGGGAIHRNKVYQRRISERPGTGGQRLSR